MSHSTEGITRVRVRSLAVGAAGGSRIEAAAAIEVTWASTQTDRLHQVYVGGRPAAVTAEPGDRRLLVPVAVGSERSTGPVLVEVVAVDPVDAWTDFSEELTGLAGAAARVRLAWQAGRYLDSNLAGFNVFTDSGTGTVDRGTPLNERPLPACPDGEESWGFGSGGFGVGAYGQAAAVHAFVTDAAGPGTWRFEIVAIDDAGNVGDLAAGIDVILTPLARPPENPAIQAYDVTDGATLTWDPSPDIE